MPNTLGFYTAEDGLFKGSEALQQLQKEGRIKPLQLIRVYNYGTQAGREQYYTVDTQGRLWGNDGKQADLEKALNEPNGWCFEGYSFERIPKSELVKIKI